MAIQTKSTAPNVIISKTKQKPAVLKSKLFWSQKRVFIAWTLGSLLGVIFLWIVFAAPSHQSVHHRIIAISHPSTGVTFVASIASNRISPGSTQKLRVELLREAPFLPKTLEVCDAFPAQKLDDCHLWPSTNGELNSSMEMDVRPESTSVLQVLTVTIKATQPSAPNESAAMAQVPAVPGISPPAPSKVKQSVSPKTFQQSILNLGPLHVENYSPVADKALRGLSRLQGIVKDLTLPILVPLLGVWFAKRASFRAEQDEVRRVLLGKVQDLTKSFYTHIVYHARSAIISIDKNDPQALSYHLLSLLMFNARLKDQEGGVFFTSQAAEEMYGMAIWIILDEVRNQMNGEVSFRDTLDKFESLPRPSSAYNVSATTGGASPAAPRTGGAPRYADFLKHMQPTIAFQTSRSFESALDILRTVTSYEYDAPLQEHWYRQPGNIEFSKDFPTDAELKNSSAEIMKRWEILIVSTKTWLSDKPAGSAWISRLPVVT